MDRRGYRYIDSIGSMSNSTGTTGVIKNLNTREDYEAFMDTTPLSQRTLREERERRERKRQWTYELRWLIWKDN